MTVANLKVKVIRKPTIKVKVLPKFPSGVTGSGGITVSSVNGNYIISSNAVGSGSTNQLAYYASTGSAVSGSTQLFQGTSALGVGVNGLTVLSIPTINTRNGTTIAAGSGPNGESGFITFWRANGTTASPTAIVNNDEMGGMQTLGWTGSTFGPPAQNSEVLFIATENWTPTANGSAVLFQATPNGTIVGIGEACIVNGLTVANLSILGSAPQGSGIGTITGISKSVNALAIGQNGATNSAFRVDSGPTNAVTGILVSAQTVAGGAAIAVISSGTNEGLAINAKGSGPITLGNVSTGAINVVPALNSAVHNITSSSAAAFNVGLAGATNPGFQVDVSAASQATGIKITGNAAAGGASIAAISSGTNEGIAINAKGSGPITFGNVSTGTINIAQALTYGGVLLTNAVTGTGKMALDTSPTFVTPTLGAATVTTLNKISFPAPATAASIIMSNNKNLTINNTLQLAGVDSTTITFQATDTYVGRATTDVLTNKTFNSAATGNVLQVSGITVSAGQYPGEPTTGNATAGNVGEYVESIIASGSAVSLVTSVAKTVTSISLTAGDWDVDTVAQFFPANTTQFTQLSVSLSLATNTLDVTPGRFFQVPQASITSNGASSYSASLPNYRFSLSTTTSIFMIVQSAFTVSTMTGFGIIRARRVR